MTSPISPARSAAGPVGMGLVDPNSGAVNLTAYGRTLQPVRRGNRTYYPLACDISDVTVAEAASTAAMVIERLGVHPADPAPILAAIGAVEGWASEHGFRHLAELIGPTAERLISDISGVEDLTFNQTVLNAATRTFRGENDPALEGQDQLRAHRARYALIAMRAATVLTRSRYATDRHNEDSLAFGLPELGPMDRRQSRALTDDEVFLCRLLVEIYLLEDVEPRTVLSYLIAESGVRSIESTPLDTTALDDRHLPTTITTTGGAWEFGARTIPLETYVAHTMARALQGLRREVDRLTYDGRQPGTGASTAALNGKLDRHLKRAGITDPYVTCKSLVFYRAERALFRDHDYTAAKLYHGGMSINLKADFKFRVDESRLASTASVRLHRHGDIPAETTVDKESFYDGTVTLKGNRRRPGAEPRPLPFLKHRSNFPENRLATLLAG